MIAQLWSIPTHRNRSSLLPSTPLRTRKIDDGDDDEGEDEEEVRRVEDVFDSYRPGGVEDDALVHIHPN